MLLGKYFDWKRDAVLTESDGCPFRKWTEEESSRSPFAFHERGFPVFLRPSLLAALDEYAGGDPYTVRRDMDSLFHCRRFEMTVKLVSHACRGMTGRVRILDLGCGEGHITAAIQRRMRNAEVSGLDYSLSAICTAAESYPNIDFAVGDAFDPPYCGDYFDVVVCNNLWEHVPDPVGLAAATRRVLKPRGFLVVSTPSRYRLGNLARALAGSPVGLMSKQHVTEYTVGQVIEQLQWAGFEVRRIEGSPLPRGSLRRALMSVITSYIRLVRSHHRLASTVFYLAQRTAESP